MELWSQELTKAATAGGGGPQAAAAAAAAAAALAGDVMAEVNRTESLLQHHNESLNQIQNAVFSVLQRGQVHATARSFQRWNVGRNPLVPTVVRTRGRNR